MLSALLLSALAAIASADFVPQSYVTENFTVPSLNVTVNGTTAPGYLFYGPVGNGYVPQGPIIMDNSGELIWYGGDFSTHNLRLQELDSKQVLTYWTGYGDSFGHGYGSIDIFNGKYKLLHTVCLQANIVTPNPDAFPGTETNPCYFDSHESYITERGTVVGTAYNVTNADLTQFNGSKTGWIFDALFYEVDIKTSKVLFSWSAKDHIPLSASNYHGKNPDQPLKIGRKVFGETRNLPWDFFHINSVQPVKGGYLVNSRMTWSFYFVNGKTGEVEWTLEGSNGGDFTLGPGIFFSWQHMPRMISQSGSKMQISLFNNDNINRIHYGVNVSTGYLLNVDTKAMQVTALKDLKDDADPVYSSAEGSYQALDNGNVLLGYGSKAVFKEFDGDGNVAYSAEFAPLSNTGGDQDSGKDVHSYRAYRYPWTAQPNTKPKAVALYSRADGTTTAYMSWNGATTYDSWTIYAGPLRSVMFPVASNIAKTGFETAVQIANGGNQAYSFVQVEALSNGKSLGKSAVVKVTH